MDETKEETNPLGDMVLQKQLDRERRANQSKMQ